MLAKRLLPALLLLAGACRESDPMPFDLVRQVPAAGNPYPVLAGGGSSDVIAYPSEYSTVAGISYRFVRHDTANPDDLLDLGEVDIVGILDSFTLSATTAAVVHSGRFLTAIDFSGPSLEVTSLTLDFDPDHAVAEGRWLLASSGNALHLVDLLQPSTRFDFTADSPVTALLPSQGSFLAFTSTGYVHVGPDVASPTFSNTFDAKVRGFEHGFADGSEAIVAGPSAAIGRSRIVRLDLATPGSPAILRSAEVEGEYFSFAWNGGSTSILAIRDDRYTYEGYRVTEGDGQFEAEGVPLPFWMDSTAYIAAHGDRLFILEMASGFYLSTYRIR